MQLQNKAITNYKKLLKLYKAGAVFTAIDTETSTSSVSDGRIIELSALKFSCKGIISSWTTLCNPHQELSEFIINLTHITQEMVDSAPDINSKLENFLEFIKDTILVGHNVQYDVRFLNSELLRADLTSLKNKFVDTLQYSRVLYPDYPKHTLEALADEFKINKGSSHRALDDASTCFQFFLQLLSDTKN